MRPFQCKHSVKYIDAYRQCKSCHELCEVMKRDVRIALLLGNSKVIESAFNKVIEERGWGNE